MYNINVSSKGNDNKGKFDVLFDPPIYFKPGTTIALRQMNIYNAIYNISSARQNNIFYIYALNNNTLSNLTSIYSSGGATLYQMTIPDGIYSVSALDNYFAKQLGDWDTTKNAPEDYNLRKIVVGGDNTSGRFTFDILSTADYDIVWKMNNIESTNSMNFFGFNFTTANPVGNTDGGNGPLDYIDIDGKGYWSLNTYRTNHGITSLSGFQGARINNGLLNINLRITNNLIFGGYTTDSISSSVNDILHSFSFSVPTGYLENIDVRNLIYLPVISTNHPIDRFSIVLTDQDNSESISSNLFEDWSFSIVVNEPDEN
jgi:hypothetical protein